MAFRCLKCTYRGLKKELEAKQCGSGLETLPFSFVDCNLWTGTLRKFADWGFADLRICYLQINHYKVAGLRTGTPRIFAKLQLPNELINLGFV
jgi:hypothetical protein